MRLTYKNKLIAGGLYKAMHYQGYMSFLYSSFFDIDDVSEPPTGLLPNTVFLVVEYMGENTEGLCVYRVLIKDRVGYVMIFPSNHKYIEALT